MQWLPWRSLNGPMKLWNLPRSMAREFWQRTQQLPVVGTPLSSRTRNTFHLSPTPATTSPSPPDRAKDGIQHQTSFRQSRTRLDVCLEARRMRFDTRCQEASTTEPTHERPAWSM